MARLLSRKRLVESSTGRTVKLRRISIVGLSRDWVRLFSSPLARIRNFSPHETERVFPRVALLSVFA
jgi:hypothetical protein